MTECPLVLIVDLHSLYSCIPSLRQWYRFSSSNSSSIFSFLKILSIEFRVVLPFFALWSDLHSLYSCIPLASVASSNSSSIFSCSVLISEKPFHRIPYCFTTFFVFNHRRYWPNIYLKVIVISHCLCTQVEWISHNILWKSSSIKPTVIVISNFF